MKLSVLIVNWNTKDLTARCVASILQNPPTGDLEIIVVDNASSDGSLEALRRQFGSQATIKILNAGANVGFAKGCNLAYAQSRGELILLLNPDTEVLPGVLSELIRYMDNHPQTGIVGPKLLNPDGTVQPSVRHFPTLFASLLTLSGAHRLLRPRHYLMDNFDYAREAEVDQVMGAAFLTRRAIIAQLGFLDEKFWLWYEEVDFCFRVRAAGYRICYFPKAAVTHHGAKSFSQMSVFSRKRAAARSLLYYFQKHGTRSEVWAIRLAVPVILAGAAILGLVNLFGFKSKLRV